MNQEQYLLICQIEEAAEVIQAACKGLRFGLDDTYNRGETPRAKLTAEMHDFGGVSQLLWAKGIIGDGDDAACKAKAERVRKFAQYSQERGILDAKLPAHELLTALKAIEALTRGTMATHCHKVAWDAIEKARVL